MTCQQNPSKELQCSVSEPQKKKTLLWHIFTYSVFTLNNAKQIYGEHSVIFVVFPKRAGN